ncbi:MAG: hypothetical protein M3P44_13720 [Actinomycetota bacterium]|nr:hypothetical protein [Actinomycetota bacterium]
MTENPMDPQGQRQPTEDEIRAAYQEQLRQVHVDDVLVQTVLSLLNMGALRAGLTAGGEADRDPAQLRSAIEGIRALMPIVEPALGQDAAPIKEALSQLQMAYARQPEVTAEGGAPEGGGEGAAPEPEQPKPGDRGPAQSSGRLWVPGQ